MTLGGPLLTVIAAEMPVKTRTRRSVATHSFLELTEKPASLVGLTRRSPMRSSGTDQQ